jgi:hypothetical protein
MRHFRVSYVPLILGIVGMLAMVALVQDRNVRTWAVVMGLTTVAAVSYAAYQEHVATRAIAVARRRVSGTPFDEMRREMDRSRRHERPFALARIPVADAADSEATAALIAALRSAGGKSPGLRSIDRSWRSADSVFLLLPETSSEGARSVIRRAVASGAGILTGDWRVVAFPEDGLTAGALFDTLGSPTPRGEDLPAPTDPDDRQPVMPPASAQSVPVGESDDS